MSLQLGTIIADVNSFPERKTKQDLKNRVIKMAGSRSLCEL